MNNIAKVAKYTISKGELTVNKKSFSAYSGREDSLNDPDRTYRRGHGPIPAGRWFVGTIRDTASLGPDAVPLYPAGDTVTYGRSGFFAHGDNRKLNNTASRGCIIVSRLARLQLADCDELLVVE